MKNYNKLVKVIQEAVPEIMELKFGCELLRTDVQPPSSYMVISSVGFANNPTKVWVSSIPFGHMSVEIDKIGIGKEFKIIGRAIRLPDVLKAINAIDDHYGIKAVDSESPELSVFVKEGKYFSSDNMSRPEFIAEGYKILEEKDITTKKRLLREAKDNLDEMYTKIKMLKQLND